MPKTLDYSEKLVCAGIMMVSSKMFEYGNQHLRISFGRENMPEILEILEKYIRYDN